MDVTSYLRRLQYSGPVEPTATTLRAIHRTHMLAVPFENLDIHLGRPIILDEQRFFEKIVEHGRGGFCYELNGLFAWLLRALNFDVTMLSARVFDAGKPGPDFDHMTLLVNCGRRWLADVGFGDSFLEPLDLDSPDEQRDGETGFRIEHEGERWRVVRRPPDAAWTTSYDFTLEPRRLEEFSAVCRWQQTSPESHFTKKRVCSMATPDGRVTLSDMKLIITRGGTREERLLRTRQEYDAEMAKHFGFAVEADRQDTMTPGKEENLRK